MCIRLLKKRIRKSFAKQQSVLDVPGLLATQLKSYDQFLQRFVKSEFKRDSWIRAAFNAAFPIEVTQVMPNSII